MHPLYPHGSIVIVDRELVQYNPYKTPEACESAALMELPRGITGQLQIYHKSTVPQLVECFCQEFERFKKQGQPLNLDSFDLSMAILTQRAGSIV